MLVCFPSVSARRSRHSQSSTIASTRPSAAPLAATASAGFMSAASRDSGTDQVPEFTVDLARNVVQAVFDRQEVALQVEPARLG